MVGRWIAGDANFARGTETEEVLNQAVYYHRLGTDQAQDKLIWSNPVSALRRAALRCSLRAALSSLLYSPAPLSQLLQAKIELAPCCNVC